MQKEAENWQEIRVNIDQCPVEILQQAGVKSLHEIASNWHNVSSSNTPPAACLLQ